MSIYDVDYKQAIKELYPTHKRNAILLRKAYSLFGDNLNLIDTLFKYFRDGATCGNWDNTSVYDFQSLVVYQRKVYYKNEYLTGYVAGVKPTDTTYWIKVLDDFIGISEKIYFGPQKIILEYALNRIFQTTFRQPPYDYADPTKHSDIYIINNITTSSNENIGIDDTESASISLNDAESDYAISLEDGDSTIKDFTVWVPNSVLASLASSPTDQKAIVSSVVTRYKLSGFLFDVQGY
jgi:hypothetical protein